MILLAGIAFVLIMASVNVAQSAARPQRRP